MSTNVKKHASKTVNSESDFFDTASLSKAYELYEGKCTCDTSYGNDCAHFLSNALINAGYSITSGVKCPTGRLIRAKELRDWAKKMPNVVERTNHDSSSSGYWFVYQERANDGQGHVCIHKENQGKHTSVGTGDYPDWEVQTHYQF
ncbi:hypothetical protein P4H61_25055 [Paenibacillus peoriae]|uniref:hypothetical protein n=1 Tax=Paenibacillus peoriae TaxID=59893 RepID=UPI001110074C|nr:hypothetical protein [Paenibacillus peoriae]MEC0184744.1 hypothetical protein [Paenibacillus peoriae]